MLAFGAALTRWTTSDGSLLAPARRSSRSTSTPRRSAPIAPVDPAVIGDAAPTAQRAELDARGARRQRRPRRRARGRDRRRPLARRALRGRRASTASSTRGRSHRPRRRCCPTERTVAVDSGHFMGFPPMYLRVPDPAGFVFTQAFQSIGLGPGDRHRRRDRAARSPHRRLPRRRRRADVAPRARDARPPAAADARRHLQRRRLRRGGPPLPPARPPGRARAVPATPTSPRWPRPPARAGSTVRSAGGPRRGRALARQPRPARWSSTRRSTPTSARNGSRRPSGTDTRVARRPHAARRRLRRRRRPHAAAERGHAGAQAPAAVRQHARPHART